MMDIMRKLLLMFASIYYITQGNLFCLIITRKSLSEHIYLIEIDSLRVSLIYSSSGVEQVEWVPGGAYTSSQIIRDPFTNN